ncbi:MAG: glycoside hydrolase family 18 protein [Paenibacillaceae bacterium]
MQIAVVNLGESLSQIANRYGVTTDSIIRLNELDQPDRLVPGQALVIPIVGSYYTVREGDSFYSIARQHGISLQSLIQVNSTVDPTKLQVGQVLRIPPAPRIIIQSNGYLQPSTAERDRAIVEEHADLLTYFSIFQYRVLRTGELVAPDDAAALQAIHATDSRPMMVVANFEEGNFSPEISRAIFTDAAVKEAMISSIIRTMKDKGFRVLNIDFENMYADDRELYNQFLREISARLHQEGFLISTALAPKTSATQVGQWYEAHDYKAHGEIVDFVIIMTYEWGWSGGPPMAVAPIPQVKAVLDFAVTVIPPAKILMGAPLYGYDWTLPFVQGGEFARSLSPQAAITQARNVGAVIRYDPVSQAPNYSYYDLEGKEHVVWFEDARSAQAKFDLIRTYGLRGISYWVLGNPFPQNWALLGDNFRIRKI